MATPVASSYVRVKLLLAPAAAAAAPSSASASASSSSSTAPACVSYAVRKLEVPRSLGLSKLHSKLAALYGGGAGAGVKLEMALDVHCMDDGAVDASSKVSGLLWEELAHDESSPGAAAAAWSQGRDKVLIRLTPQPAAVVSPASASAAAPVPFTRVVLQPMIPAKSPAPWPRFSPAPGSLPIIILNNEERDWEVLDDEDFDQLETDAAQAPCKTSSSAAAVSQMNSAADIAAKNPRAPIAEVLAASASAKPHRVIAPELLAKLSGGSPSTSSSSSSTSALGAAVPPAPFSGSITFSVNKTVYTVANPGPMVKVADYLRYELSITGPKIGCGEGGCGACIVLLSRQDPTTGQLVSFSTNACLHPLASLDGWAVTTTEGLVTEADGVASLHPIQTAVVNNWATQCGYWSESSQNKQTNDIATALWPFHARGE